MFRFHSNGCDSNDDRQACCAVQRNLSALQATEDALPGMRVALCATRRIDRAATNHQDREDEDQQAERRRRSQLGQ